MVSLFSWFTSSICVCVLGCYEISLQTARENNSPLISLFHFLSSSFCLSEYVLKGLNILYYSWGLIALHFMLPIAIQILFYSIWDISFHLSSFISVDCGCAGVTHNHYKIFWHIAPSEPYSAKMCTEILCFIFTSPKVYFTFDMNSSLYVLSQKNIYISVYALHW